MNAPAGKFELRWLVHWRDVVLVLVRRDFRGRYKHTKIGFAWSVISPLLFLLIFYCLFTKIINLQIPRYASFVFTGIVAWSWTQGALLQSVSSISSNAPLVNQPGFPIAALPVIAVLISMINFLFALPFLFVLLWIEGTVWSASLLSLPAIMAVQFLFILSLAYMVAALNVAFRDVEQALPILLQLGYYVTPVFYDLAKVPAGYHWAFNYNPIAVTIENYRAVLMNGQWPDWQSLGWVTLASLVLLVLGVRYFNRARFRFLEEL